MQKYKYPSVLYYQHHRQLPKGTARRQESSAHHGHQIEGVRHVAVLPVYKTCTRSSNWAAQDKLLQANALYNTYTSYRYTVVAVAQIFYSEEYILSMIIADRPT